MAGGRRADVVISYIFVYDRRVWDTLSSMKIDDPDLDIAASLALYTHAEHQAFKLKAASNQ